MELQSSCSTQHGTSLAAPCNSTDDNATSKALRNALVLDNIFANIDTTNLKKARLVCHDWSDAGAGVLGKRTVLNVSKVFRDDESNLYPAAPVHDKLTRHLYIRDDFDLSKRNTITNIFTDLSSNLSQVTREIVFCVTLKKFASEFVNGLRTLESPQIQQISIIIRSSNPYVNKGLRLAFRALPDQTNLTSLKFQLPRDIQRGIHAFQPLLQVLLDSSPNLTSLDVAASFCPNLEGRKNLKALKFCFENCKHVACSHFELATVMSMLTQVKDSLIELELCYDVLRAYYEVVGGHEILDRVKIQGPNTGVPVMSSVTSLTINPPDVYLIQDFFDEEHLPKLKNLSLNTHGFLITDSSPHLNLWKRHRGVQSLALGTGSNFQAMLKYGEKIVYLFPAVRKFDLSLNAFDNFDHEVMQPFQLWDLEEVKLVLWNVRVASLVVGVLRSMSTWSGVKSVHFEQTNIKEDDFSGSIRDVILYSGGFKRVEISGLVGQVLVDVIRPIFEVSGAPVYFKGGVYRNYVNLW